jgi:hypothetical protein
MSEKNLNNVLPNSVSKSDQFIDSPLIMMQPMNIIVLLVFYSPVIIAVCVLGMSFIFQNFKGFIYLGFLLGISVFREFLLMILGVKSESNPNKICNMVQYSAYGNSGFSLFVISFTLAYICTPMFINSDVNYLIFGGLLAYLLVDIGIRYMKKCITTYTDVFLNIFTGLLSGVIIPGLLYAGNSSKHLFFNEISTSKEVCSMPKKQQFKCAVYKNGELIGNA